MIILIIMLKKNLFLIPEINFISRYVSYKQPLLLAKSFKELEDEGLLMDGL